MNINKIPIKLFLIIILIVTIITFFIMNFSPVSVSLIFFSVKIPLTLLFFIFLALGVLLTSFYWKNKYNDLKAKNKRLEKLLFKKEEIENDNLE